MRPHFTLGRVLGVPLQIHVSWLLLAGLIMLSLGARFTMIYPAWSPATVWLTMTATAAMFFVSLLLHELSHALVAKAAGMHVRSITLFALGGLARIDKDAETPATEFWIGLVGPLTSAAIGALCIFGSAAGPSGPVQASLIWLGYINVAIAAFNLLPGFPLDGGRVLRAAIWRITGDHERATRAAATAGQMVAAALIVVGVFRWLSGLGAGSLWLALIGWFLLGAARASRLQTLVGERLDGVSAADVMSHGCVHVTNQLSVQGLVDRYLRTTPSNCFVVETVGHGAGLVTERDIQRVDREHWRNTPVGAIMHPIAEITGVLPTTPVTDVLTMMDEDVNDVPVIADGEVLGTISRERIVEVLRLRSEVQG